MHNYSGCSLPVVGMRLLSPKPKPQPQARWALELEAPKDYNGLDIQKRRSYVIVHYSIL